MIIFKKQKINKQLFNKYNKIIFDYYNKINFSIINVEIFQFKWNILIVLLIMQY